MACARPTIRKSCWWRSPEVDETGLDRHVEGQGWAILSSELVVIEQDARIMARLHAMNIRTWSQDAMARRSFDPGEIAAVQSGLDAIASGQQSARPVRNTLRQLVAVKV
jgi:hypothetical protein